MHPRVAYQRLKVFHINFIRLVVPQHKHPFIVGINGIQRGAEPGELRRAVLLHDVFMEAAHIRNGFAGGVLNAARIPLRAVLASVIGHARVGVQRNDVQHEGLQSRPTVIVAAVHDPRGNGLVQPQLRIGIEAVVVVSQDAVPRQLNGSKQADKIFVDLRVAAVLNAAVIKVVPRIQHEPGGVRLNIGLHCGGGVLRIFQMVPAQRGGPPIPYGENVDVVSGGGG